MVLWRDIPGALDKVRAIGAARARRKKRVAIKLSQWDRQRREWFFFAWQAIYTASTLGFGQALASVSLMAGAGAGSWTAAQVATTQHAITASIGFTTTTIPLMANGTLTANERRAQILGSVTGVVAHKGLNWLFDRSTLERFDNLVTDQISGNPNILQRGGAARAILFPWWQIAFGW